MPKKAYPYYSLQKSLDRLSQSTNFIHVCEDWRKGPLQVFNFCQCLMCMMVRFGMILTVISMANFYIIRFVIC